ncbi:MAG: hypothetical protein U0T82_12160 [Bacteroidales bacterium]
MMVEKTPHVLRAMGYSEGFIRKWFDGSGIELFRLNAFGVNDSEQCP